MGTKVYIASRLDTPLANDDQSLSEQFRRYNSGNIEFVGHASDADLVIVFEAFSHKSIHYRAQLEADWFVNNYLDRLFTINFDDTTCGFLPGCYTSLTRSNFDPRFHRACSYPKTYNQMTAAHYGSTVDEAKLLFSFTGSLLSHPIRRRLHSLFSMKSSEFSVTAVNTQFHAHSELQKEQYVLEILDSKFALCPRGWSPSTYRLFEVMSLGRCPVIISDGWVAPDGIDWDSCSIRIEERHISSMPLVLRARAHEAKQLGKAARYMWEGNFSDESKYLGYWNKIQSIRSELHFAHKKHTQRWRSEQFLRANEWLPWQRLFNRLRRMRSGA